MRWILTKLARLALLLVGGGFGIVAITACLALLAPELAKAGSAARFSAPQIGSFEPLYERSVVYDAAGNELAVLRSEQNRTLIPLDQIPKPLIDAVIDTEDAAFYRHKGVNARATARALWANVEAGGVEQGGSTITQQLVKNTLITNKRDLNRKVREARLALQLERTWTKPQILERYLNTVYFGQGAYGVQAASERYFNRPAKDLDVAQSAFLAGMIRNPSGYDVTRFPERARDRRAVVLDRMLTEKHLSELEAEQAKGALLPHPVDRLKVANTYFVEEVKQRLLDDGRLGVTPRARYNAVFNGGLRIYTTLDPRYQRIAEATVADVLGPTKRPEFTAAVVSIDPSSGAVRAMVGGRGFATDRYNLATQGKRQPGSSWKPFTLIAALESGISPQSLISGIEPCPIPNPGGKPDPYLPGNSERSNGRVATLVDQITISSNCAFARLAYLVGPDRVISVARRLGVTSRLDPVPAMALGSEEVRPIEMAGAYATVAADGVFHAPYLVERVEDASGSVLFRADHSGRRALSPQVARETAATLTNVVLRGTGTRANLGTRVVAGKTGTAQNYEDAWFVGFTPELATAVWMGAPSGKISMRSVGGIAVMGGTYPARIWHDFTQAILEGRPLQTFTDPDPALVPPATCLSFDLSPAYQRLAAAPSTRSSTRRSTRRAVSISASRGAGIELQLEPAPTAKATRSTKVTSKTGSAKLRSKSRTRGCSGSTAATGTGTAKAKKVRARPKVKAKAAAPKTLALPTPASESSPVPAPTLAPEPDPAPAPGPFPALDPAAP